MRIFLILFLTILSVNGTDLEPKKKAMIESAGLSFKILKGMKVIPSKVLSARFWTQKGEYGTKKVEAYPVEDLWRQEQVLIQYKNESCIMTVCQVKTPYPKESDVEKISRDYTTAESYLAHSKKKVKWNTKKLKEWSSSFAGQKVTSAKNGYLGKNYKYKCRQLAFESKKKQHYSFILYRKKSESILVDLQFDTDLDKKKLSRACSKILRTFSFTRVKESGGSTKFSSKKTRKNGERSDKYKIAVERVKKEVLGMKGWWYAETANYIMKSNMEKKERKVAIEIQKNLESMREVFERTLPPKGVIERVSVVTVLKSRTEFLKYLEGTGVPDWAGGVWMPSRGELVLYNIKNSKTGTMEVLGHEAFHQYLTCATDAQTSPVWFNEGTAGFFEGTILKKSGQAKIGEHRYHLRKILPYIKGSKFNLESFVHWKHNEFYTNKEIGYPLGWALTYFLRKAGHLYKDKPYGEICERLLKKLYERKSWTAANDYAFEGVDFKELQKDFIEFWDNKRLRKKALKTKIVPKKKK